MATSLKISYPKELIPELMSKVVGHSTLAKLSNQIPVYFTYSIAVASPNNSISYFNDIYSQTKFYTKKLN